MDPTWAHPGQLHPQLQLENEYAVDPAQFPVLQTDSLPPSDPGMQRFDRHSTHQGVVYPAFGPGYPQDGSQQTFPYQDPATAMSSSIQQAPMDVHFNGHMMFGVAGENPHQTPQQNFQPSPNLYFNDVPSQAFSTPYDVHATQQQNLGIGTPQRASTQHLTPISTLNGNSNAYTAGMQRRSSSQHSFYGVASSPGISANSYSAHSAHNSPPEYPNNYGGYFGMDGDAAPATKRARGDEEVDDEEIHDQDAQQGADGKPRPPGACANCKRLKVKCEFIRDEDICARCLKNNQECHIPGRKKRRPPPKREILINQIKEQATQIESLMEQLAEANRRAAHRRSRGSADSRGAPAISLVPGSSADELTAAIAEVTVKEEDAAAMQDWISKAREAMNAFGGYIRMGGPSVTREMLGEDAEGSGSEGSEELVSADDADDEVVDSAIVMVEGENPEHFQVPEGMDASSPDESGRGRGRFRAGFSRESTESAPDANAPGGHFGKKTRKLATLPSESAPLGLMAELALKSKSSRRSSRDRDGLKTEDADVGVGLANANYFRPSPTVERPIISESHQPPHILRNGLVTTTEVEKLFKIYFDYMNLSVSLLDPVLYTAQKTYWRSPFLFTVICAIASRHYNARPELYQEAMKYARLAAGTALIGGQKSVEVVQAYILLSLYPVPSRRWEEDRCWVYLGLAIRVATDLNLHYPNTPSPDNEMHAREMLNRTRTWLNCFNLDRSTSSQYGKSPIISNADYVASNSEWWWQSSPWNLEGFDVHLCCYNAELKLLGEFRGRIFSNPNHPTGMNKTVDFASIASEYDDRLARLWETWAARIREIKSNDPQHHFRTGLLKLAYSYARLTVLAVGFQHSKMLNSSEAPFLWRCLRAATDVVKAVLDDIAIPSQKIYLRHGPEAQSVFLTFASAFLVKLLQPKYMSFISREQRIEIRDLVQRVIDMLGSPEVSIDDRHGPKLYSLFLKGLLATPMARIDHSPGSIKRDTIAARRYQQKHLQQPSTSSGADTTPSLTSGPTSPTLSSGSSVVQSPILSAHSPTALAQLSPMQANGTLQSGQRSSSHHSTPEFLAPPLPFDHEMIQSMQSLTETSFWQDVQLPGFYWMGSGQNDPLGQQSFPA